MSAVQYLFYHSSHRTQFWNEIILSLYGEAYIDNEDSIILTQLKLGQSWLSFIPGDWQILYGHIYDYYLQNSSSTTNTTSTTSPSNTNQLSLLTNLLLPNEINKIEKDIYRTFAVFVRDTQIGKLGLKLVESHFCPPLRQLLYLLTYHMGYTQGMNYIVAEILLIEPSIRNCYIILSYLMYYHHVSLLFISKTSCLSQYIKLFDKKFQLFYPILHFHLQENGFYCYCYTVDWFTTCFIRSAPGELSLHIMELLLLGMKDIMIRIGLSIMHLLHDTLLKLEEDDLHLNFKSLVKQLNAKDVIFTAIKINLNRKKKPDVEENILQV